MKPSILLADVSAYVEALEKAVDDALRNHDISVADEVNLQKLKTEYTFHKNAAESYARSIAVSRAAIANSERRRQGMCTHKWTMVFRNGKPDHRSCSKCSLTERLK